MIGGLGKRVLMQRARDYVLRYHPQLVGITGSWGLGLTKRALETVLRDYTTLRVSADGVAGGADVALGITGGRGGQSWMQMLGLGRIREAMDDEPRTILVEVAASRPGFVDEVASTLPFSVAVATNVHTNRLTYFTRRELVAHEILSLPISLGHEGIAVVNLDEPLLASAADNIQARVVGYGITPAADVRISRLEPASSGGFAVELRADSQFFEGHLPYCATRMQAHVVVAALAAAYALIGDAKVIASGLRVLQSFAPSQGYGTLTGEGDQIVLADTLDATPESVEAGLRSLARMRGRKIVILGDIIDLGGGSQSWHEGVGEQAAEAADIAIFVGDQMRAAQAAALKSMHRVDTHHFESSRDVGKWLKDYVHSGDTIFMAGSQETEMGRALPYFEEVL